MRRRWPRPPGRRRTESEIRAKLDQSERRWGLTLIRDPPPGLRGVPGAARDVRPAGPPRGGADVLLQIGCIVLLVRPRMLRRPQRIDDAARLRVAAMRAEEFFSHSVNGEGGMVSRAGATLP